MLRFILILLLLVACSREQPHKAVAEGSSNDAVTALRQTYETEKATYTSSTSTAGGWASVTDCDSALFSGLALAAGVDVRLDLAELSPGEFHRRPSIPCWTERDGDLGSKSTISNDMFIGILWGSWETRDLPALQRIADYGQRHSWIMGKPESLLSRVLLKPNQIGLLGRMIFALSGGADDRSYRDTFEYYAGVDADFERHIQALGIALQGSVNEALRKNSLDATVEPGSGESFSLLDINDQMMERVKDLVRAEPSNPLFHALLGTYTGDFSRAIGLLLDPATPVPSYVRSGDGLADANYWRAEWLFAAHLVLERYPE